MKKIAVFVHSGTRPTFKLNKQKQLLLNCWFLKTTSTLTFQLA